LYTAPMHGYLNALDYWTRAASLPLLQSIRTPTLALNARNDPLVPEASLPGSRDASGDVLLHQPAQGGHGGFVTGMFPGNLRWLPARLLRFFGNGC
ncbi:MAG: alpha/beta fold hydrolase, partial [Castellaniella sp.]